MSSKQKNTTTTSGTGMETLKIGSRVRCTDDGVTGRITWANGVSVKIKWDDGEQVTWKRDSLATRPIEILDVETATVPDAATPAPSATLTEGPAAVEQMPAEPTVMAPGLEDSASGLASLPEVPPEAVTVAADAEAVASFETPAAQSAAPATEQASAAVEAPTVAIEQEATAPAKPKRQRKAPAEPKEKKISAIDAAARVLAEAGTPMTTQEMIGAMAGKGYWTSPGGKTPAATLYSALLREITTKGEQSRFVKVGPGRFGRRA